MWKFINIVILHNNNLTSIPKSIGKLSNLQELDLNDNNLTSLPESIQMLTKLQSLNLSDNNLMNIPLLLYCIQNYII